jgi:hypothetical protein
VSQYLGRLIARTRVQSPRRKSSRGIRSAVVSSKRVRLGIRGRLEPSVEPLDRRDQLGEQAYGEVVALEAECANSFLIARIEAQKWASRIAGNSAGMHLDRTYDGKAAESGFREVL